jgi:hypothetical protein
MPSPVGLTFLAFLTRCEITVTCIEAEGTRIFHAGIFASVSGTVTYCSVRATAGPDP